jgi:hypothetical protein
MDVELTAIPEWLANRSEDHVMCRSSSQLGRRDSFLDPTKLHTCPAERLPGKFDRRRSDALR